MGLGRCVIKYKAMRIQRAKDPENLTGFEQKHLPWILIPDFVKKGEKFEVVVKVGEVDHPMCPSHYVKWIGLCVGDGLVKKIKLNFSDLSEAKFKISLDKDVEIRAREECNLHGVWESSKKIILYRG